MPAYPNEPAKLKERKMAHFRATIQGTRGEASRLGTKSTGIQASINGWDIGLNVDIIHNEAGQDKILVSLTGGSNQKGEKVYLAGLTRKDLDRMLNTRKQVETIA